MGADCYCTLSSSSYSLLSSPPSATTSLRTTLHIELAEDPTSRLRSRIEGALVLTVVEVPVEGLRKGQVQLSTLTRILLAISLSLSTFDVCG